MGARFLPDLTVRPLIGIYTLKQTNTPPNYVTSSHAVRCGKRIHHEQRYGHVQHSVSIPTVIFGGTRDEPQHSAPPSSLGSTGINDSFLTNHRLVVHRKDKWNASGANEAMSRMTASIPEGTKTYVSSIFKREHIRSVSVFFGIGEERAFYVEKAPSLLVERLRHNLTFFYLNYMMLTGLLFCLSIVTNFKTIVGLAILGLVWMWFVRASASGTLELGRKYLIRA